MTAIVLNKEYSALGFRQACLGGVCPQKGALLEISMCSGYKADVVLSGLFDNVDAIAGADLNNVDFDRVTLKGEVGKATQMYILLPRELDGNFFGYGIVSTVKLVVEDYFETQKREIETPLLRQNLPSVLIHLIREYLY